MGTRILSIITLGIVWVGLNQVTWQFTQIFYALLAIVFTYLISWKLGLLPKKISFNLKTFLYLIWLIKELIISSIATIKYIWQISPKFKSETRFVDSLQTTELGLVVLANSITLTPGTLTIEISKNQLRVHALHNESFLGIKDMDRRVMQVMR